MVLHQWLKQNDRPAAVMGVLNLTPDSFSDGGRFSEVSASVDRALELIAEGADLLDIGGESTRPGAERVSASDQIKRIVPTIEQLRGRIDVPISVDTTSAEVARAAIDAGASLINDVSAGREDVAMFLLLAERQVPVVLMQMLGVPASMQHAPQYDDVVEDVKSFLRERVRLAINAGIKPERIIIDPGIGFGKTLQHNLALLHHLKEFAGIAQALLVGTSRKAFIGTLTQTPVAEARVFGTAGSVAWSIANGADIVRVHDVAAMRQVVQVVAAIQRYDNP